MKESVFFQLVSKNEKAVWCLGLPQVAARACIDLSKASNAEVNKSLHGKFECVWLFECPVNFYYNWRQIVLSGVKLISNKGGFLIIKTYNTKIARETEVLEFLKIFITSFEEVQSYVESNRGYRVSIFKIKQKVSALPENITFKTKEGEISRRLVTFYKVLHKLNLK